MVPKTSSEIKPDVREIVMNKLRLIPCMGLIFALLSATFFATATFLVDLMDGVDAAFVVTARSIMQLLIFLPWTIYFREPILGVKGESLALWGKCITSYLTTVLQYYSLSFISLGDSSAIGFSAPVFASLFACIHLQEPCGIFQVTSILITLTGVVLIARPSFLFPSEGILDIFSTSDRVTGIILSVLTCLMISYSYIYMRKLVKTPTVSCIVAFSIFSIFAGSINMNLWSFLSGKLIALPQSPKDWILIALNGFCGILGHINMQLAFKLEEAGLVSLILTFNIVMSFIYQGCFLSQPIHVTSIVGATIVCSGCVAVALKKFFESKNDARNDANQVKNIDISLSFESKSCA